MMAPYSNTSQALQAFMRFHQANPHVYDRLVALARNLKTHHHAAGIGTLWEVLRHDYLMQGLEVPIGLNNNHRSRYARLIMAMEPDLKGFFEVRPLAVSGGRI